MMRAITLWPEWAWAVCWLGKDVENRNWMPPEGVRGRRLAIHAGRNWGGRPGAFALAEACGAVSHAANFAAWDDSASSLWVQFPKDVGYKPHAVITRLFGGPVGGEVGMTLGDLDRVRLDAIRPAPVSAIVATAIVGHYENLEDGLRSEDGSRWRSYGGYAWHLSDVRVFDEPIKGVRGSQGIWTLPEPVVERLATSSVSPARDRRDALLRDLNDLGEGWRPGPGRCRGCGGNFSHALSGGLCDECRGETKP